MVSILHALNRSLTPFFDAACWPFRSLAPIWAMIAVSLLSGILMVWVFGKVSNQAAIKHLRERIRGNLIGVRLYQADIGVMLRLQRRIFGDTFRYMRHAVVPMAILLVPVVLIMTQLNLRFAVRPLNPGEQVVVKAFVRDPSWLDGPVDLDAGSGVSVEAGGVRIRSAREVAWRIRVDSPGEHVVAVRIGEQTLEARVVAGGRWGRVPQRRTGRGMWDTLLYPGEPPIPASHPIEAVEINYPALDLEVMGVGVNWLVAFFVLSIAFGFVFKRPLGVEV